MIDLELLVIGAGQAAGPLLSAARTAGVPIRVAERDRPGGACVNWGCTPTKAVLASARLLSEIRRADEFGLRVGEIEADLGRVLESARTLVERSRASVAQEIGDDLVRGEARVEGRDGDRWVVAVGESRFRTERLVLNVGARSRVPDLPGLHDPILAENWLDRPDVPARLAILGGGYIACEMARFYHAFGREVTIVERSDRLLAHEIDPVSESIRACLEADGVRVLLNAEVERIDGPRLVGTDVEADALFVATGRAPNLPVQGLDDLETEKGWAKIDDRFRTNLPNLYAVGDVRGGAMFTHTAWDDGRTLAAGLFGTGGRTTRATMVPYAVFTHPPLGRTGEMTGELLEFDVAKNGAAQAERADFGRVWIAHEGGVVKGAAVHAAHGADLAQFLSPFVAAGLTVDLLRDLLTVHPTFTEAVQSAVLA